MRRAYLVLMAAGCGFRSPGGSPDLPVPDGGVPDMRSFGATELRAGTLVDMTVDGPRSSLTPNAYTYGGLVAHGLQGTRLWTNADINWGKLATVTATGAGMWCGERLGNKVTGTRSNVDYLGVLTGTAMTLWLEGEVWLDGNPGEMFHVNGDDVGFVEIARPGTTAYTSLGQNKTAAVPATVTAGGAGWYPVRVGFANQDANFDFQFTHTDPGGSDIPWTRERMRARTSELSGALRTVFGRQILAGGQGLTGSAVAPPVLHFDQSDLLPMSLQAPPQGAPGKNTNDDWSARYLGQVYITKPGGYMLLIDSDDGNRGRLADGHGEQHWRRDEGVGLPPLMTTMVPATLVAGWNDLVVDYNQVGGTSFLHVRIQGPDFPSAVEIPRDRLRPVEPADDRLALGVNDQQVPVPQDGDTANPATTTLTVVGYTTATGTPETVDSIELTYEVNSQHWDQITVELEAPTTSAGPGARVAIRTRDGNGGNGDRIVGFSIPSSATGSQAMLLHGPADGDWKLHVSDAPGGTANSSSLVSARLTLHTKGGPDKLARMASWTSQVIDAQTPVFAVDRVAWTERATGNAKVAVHVRTCQQADCSDATWPDPIAPGVALNVPHGRYLQLRVDMTSDGTVEPELSGLSIAFRRDP